MGLTERHPRCGHTGAGAAVIKSYLRQLSSSETSMRGQIVRRFICCTVESDLTCPTLVMRNMRQVMSGLTNYLLITGEGDLANIVKMATREEPGLRLETVLEDLMQEMVVRPLSKHLH